VSPPIGGQTETLLPTGKVLIAGGTNEYHNLFGAKLYDPTTNSWLNTGSMNTFRSGHTATLLQNGLVLAAGGSSISGVIASAELYEP
jgi:hypothetical protein